MSRFSVEGRNAIVTGASQGIGEGIAKTLAEAGANVAICSRSMDRVGPVADQIEDAGGTAFAMECNVREEDQIEDFVDATVDEFGGLDLMVANAGGEFVAPFEEISANGWQTIVDLNLNSTRHCAHAAGEYMRENGGGDIVTMASVNGQHPSPGESHYGASKAAIIHLTQTLATEWADHEISVNCIAPGLIQTPGVADTLGIEESDMPPRERVNRRIGYAEDIADVVHFLASPAAAFVTGETITVKGVPRPGNSTSEDLGLEE